MYWTSVGKGYVCTEYHFIKQYIVTISVLHIYTAYILVHNK